MEVGHIGKAYLIAEIFGSNLIWVTASNGVVTGPWELVDWDELPKGDPSSDVISRQVFPDDAEYCSTLAKETAMLAALDLLVEEFDKSGALYTLFSQKLKDKMFAIAIMPADDYNRQQAILAQYESENKFSYLTCEV